MGRFVMSLRSWKIIVLALVLGALAAGVPLLLGVSLSSTVLISLPALLLVMTGGILPLAPALWSQLRHSLAEAPVVDPLVEPAGNGPDSFRARARARASVWMVNWMMVIGAVVLSATAVWMDTLVR